MELVDILKGVELFRGLSTDQLERLASISHQETYNTDDIIFKQGSLGDQVYIVTDGQVEVRVEDEKGGDHTAIYLGRGQIFGEMALLDHSQRSASVIACQDNTVLYGISNRNFMALCQADTALGYVMMRNIAMDLSFKLRHRNLDPSAHL